MKTIKKEGTYTKECLDSFVVRGEMILKTWYNEIGTIEMDTYSVSCDLEKEGENILIEKIKEEANDAGFGSQEYIAINVDVFRMVKHTFEDINESIVYENINEKYLFSKLITINEEEYEKIKGEF